MDIELPYAAEYAKSGRALCKGCKTNIPQGSLRIAVLVQSAFHDGKQHNWFHKDCFFKKQRPGSVGDIANYENLRFEDQKKVEKLIVSASTVVAGNTSMVKGKKRSKTDDIALKDYGIEYAKSGRSTCRGCELKILKDEVRIRKTIYDTEVGMKYGGQPLWHHVSCFTSVRVELGWLDTGENLPGFSSLKAEDKAEIKRSIPPLKAENIPNAKKPKLEKLDENEIKVEKTQEEKYKKQNERYFMFRDAIQKSMKKDQIIELLEYNNQDAVSGNSEKLLDQAADLLAFGALESCSECKGRQLLFDKSGYLCAGNLSEWTKCTNLIKEPERKQCRFPSNFKDELSFLSRVKKPETRIVRYVPPSATTIAKNVALKKNSDELDGPKVKRERPPLYQLKFTIVGLKSDEEDIRKRIMKLGGIYSNKVTEQTIAIISNEKEVKKLGSAMRKAREFGIHIVPKDYLDMVESNKEGAITYITSMSLCDWGTDPSVRIPQEEAKSLKSKSIYTKSVPKSLTLKVKGGLAVDPDSQLDHCAHVFVKNKDKYSVVLGLTDIQRNKNSFYKMQLLESDIKDCYWVFRAWGRIGTTIGGNKLESFSNLFDAIHSFNTIYREKTGNDFDNRDNFVKLAGRMYPVDIDYEDTRKTDLSAEHHVTSKLEISVQSLIKLIFDIDTMKRTMMEFHLDMEKMPLGKLSIKQIQSAYKVLTEIYELIQGGGSNAKFIDTTNRFYTLIPHNFGVQAPPLLDTIEQVENLRQMLDSLAEIECAYSLIKSEDTSEDINPLDKHYETLKTKLEPLDKESEEFNLLSKYVKNTHGETHKAFELEIVDIFKVTRQGEARRYKPFKKLHNRKLLWHGSRVTNFVGILSHGLKIAPPEAPVTGYMFGKGIYFADMVSKSANYCCASQQNSTGLMLLSEVALGDMLECTSSKYITKLPNNKHSCLGKGRTMPNPEESYKREDGVEIPFGKPITDSNLKSSLLYNEYIIYDIAQINIKYLLRMEFKYKY